MPEIRDFELAEVGEGYFIARWTTDVPCHCRIQMSTTRSMANARDIVAPPAMTFEFDSRGTAYGNLPPMGRYWVRVLAADGAGGTAASATLELLVPPGEAMRDLRLVPLGGDQAFVEWWSAEPLIGQVTFIDFAGVETRTPFEPGPRRWHMRTISGLTPGATYTVRLRQGLEREKFGDQFLRAAPETIHMPSAPTGVPYVLQQSADCAVLAHRHVRLAVFADGRLRVFRADGSELVTVVSGEGPPPFTVTLADGTVLDDFSRDAVISPAKPTTGEFGPGLGLTVLGTGYLGIQRTLQFEMYASRPDACIVRVAYDLPTGVKVAMAQSLCFRLDRRLAVERPGRVEAWWFHGYLPHSHAENFAETYTAARLEPGFSREHRMLGDGTQARHGTGVPLFDFWGAETGLAIGHLHEHHLPVAFPVEVSGQGVQIAFRDDRKVDGSYASPPLLLVAHRLDFFDAAARYSELMRTRGLRMAPVPEAAYEPVWSTWGYERSFTKDDVRRVLPLLERLGVRWIQFDDPWYADHGDFTVNRAIFPGGDEDLAAFIRELKDRGFKVRLWTCAGHVTDNAPYYLKHRPRTVRDSGGQPVPVHSAGAPSGHAVYDLCPCVEENRAFVIEVVERMISLYGADGLYHDGIYGCPACFARDHGHADPADTAAAHASLYREAYARVMDRTDGQGVVMLCTCGKSPNFFLLPSVNRVATADPMPIHVRQRVKSLKALMGPRAAADYDFVEVTLNSFAGAVGTGACLYYKFTTPLEPALFEEYSRWTALWREHDLARGDYLNLYDVIHDVPEMHAVRKGSRTYYALYASPWAGDESTPFTGPVELRGLDAGIHYRVHDYVNDMKLGTVTGATGRLSVAFKGFLLLFAEPVA